MRSGQRTYRGYLGATWPVVYKAEPEQGQWTAIGTGRWLLLSKAQGMGTRVWNERETPWDARYDVTREVTITLGGREEVKLACCMKEINKISASF